MSNKPWLAQYSSKVPHEIDLNAYKNLGEVMAQAVAANRDLPIFENMGKALTYGELDRKSDQFASHLAARGIKQGDRVAIMMPNCLQYPVALFGTLKLGAIVVNCNPLYTPRELEHQLKDSGSKAIVIIANFANTLEQVIAKTPDLQHVVVTELGDALGFKGHIVNFVVKHVKKMVPSFSLPKAMSFKAALAEGASGTYPKPMLTHTDVAFLQYTGGTTGVSKGAVLTHGNIIANIVQARAWINGYRDINDRELIIGALPLYHIFALTVCMFVYMSLGSKIVLITNPKDIPGFIKELAKHKFTMLPGVNTLFNALLNDPEFAKLDFSALRYGLGGGMAVQRATAERWQQVTGKPLIEAYGLTETSPGVTINPMNDQMIVSSIGLPIPSTELELRDDQGRAVAQGERGEICVRGPQVMQGYWNRPDETAKVLDANGWFGTGDVGRIDEKGFVYIVDRKKDMILVSGFNVYPNEVEDAVALHKGVLEVAAIGVPDDKSGEAVKIFVVKRDASLTAEALQEHCKEQLTGYKRPQHIEFRDSLPKTNVGKILRRELRDAELAKLKSSA